MRVIFCRRSFEIATNVPFSSLSSSVLQNITDAFPFSREILDLYGELCAVISGLDQKWTAALLHRSQLSNPYFLQDLFTTFQLLSAALCA